MRISSLLFSASIKQNSQVVLFKQCLNIYFQNHLINCHNASRILVSMIIDVSVEMDGVISTTQRCTSLCVF